MKGSVTTPIGGQIYVDGDEIAAHPDFLKVGMIAEGAHIEFHMPLQTARDLVSLLEIAQDQVRYRLGQRRCRGARK